MHTSVDDRIRLHGHERPIDQGWATRERALLVVLAGATLLALFLCWQMTRPFVPALAWALALAVVARPAHDWIAARVANPNVGAGLAVALVGVALVLPALFVTHRLVTEAARGIEQAQSDLETGRWQAGAEEYPRLAALWRWVEGNFDVRQEIANAIPAVGGNLTGLLTGSVWAVVQLLLSLFALFFFFRDRRIMVRGVRRLVPLSEAEADDVLMRVSDTVHATVYGTVLVALIQGALGGLMFWWLGLPAPVTWGAVMALLAVVPYLGAFVVWAPAAAFLALQGDWGKAVLLTAWGTVAVGLIDNLLYRLLWESDCACTRSWRSSRLSAG